MLLQFYERQTYLWKIMSIHHNAIVPRQACREDWLVAIKHNGHDRGQKIGMRSEIASLFT